MKMANNLSTPLKNLFCLIAQFEASSPDSVQMLTFARAIAEVLEEMQAEVKENTIPTCEALVSSHIKSLIREDLSAMLSIPDTKFFKDG